MTEDETMTERAMPGGAAPQLLEVENLVVRYPGALARWTQRRPLPVRQFRPAGRIKFHLKLSGLDPS